MGGGILPIAKNDGFYYVLLSRESLDIKWKESGKWSDFGGSKEGNETEYETAIREGTEETSGIYGKAKNIKYMIDTNTLCVIKVYNYSTYLISVNYNPMISYRFSKIYNKALRYTPELVLNTSNGLYEKDKIRWVKVDDLNTFSTHSRFWFKPIMMQIYNRFNSKNKNSF